MQLAYSKLWHFSISFVKCRFRFFNIHVYNKGILEQNFRVCGALVIWWIEVKFFNLSGNGGLRLEIQVTNTLESGNEPNFYLGYFESKLSTLLVFFDKCIIISVLCQICRTPSPLKVIWIRNQNCYFRSSGFKTLVTNCKMVWGIKLEY